MPPLYPHGWFCFADLNTSDIETATRFYGGVLGWQMAGALPSDGGYSLFQSNGRAVAGLRHAHSTPPGWISYVTVESADDTAARAQELGATIIAEPADVAGTARTCVLQDPEGAQFGLWEARDRRGADVQDVSGAMWWVELLARDVIAARSFYSTLFPWTSRETSTYGLPYTVFTMGDLSVAGAAQIQPDWDVSPRWQVFFSVPDFELSAKQTRALGGRIEFERDVPVTGRMGIVRDSEQALFAVMRPNMLTEMAEELIRTVEDANVRLRALSEAEVSVKPAPTVWSIKEILGHLVDSATNNHQRFVRAQHVDSLTFPGYEQDDWVRTHDYQGTVWLELVEFWRLYNRRLAYLIRRIPESKLNVPCQLGANEPASLGFLIGDYLIHLRHHLAQIEERRSSLIA